MFSMPSPSVLDCCRHGRESRVVQRLAVSDHIGVQHHLSAEWCQHCVPRHSQTAE